MRDRSIFVLLTVLAAAAAPTTVMARPGGWDGPGWGQSRWDRPGWESPRSTPRSLESRRSDEGRVQVARFVAEGDAAQALGHGAIAVASGTEGQDYVPQGNRSAYEAAVVDQLVHAGYETAPSVTNGASQTDGQLAELTVTRTVIQPAEAKRNPVSGEAAVSVSNRGTAYGLAVNVDLTKPLPPLVSTKLEARIRDRATNTVLWEGRAEVASREGADGWGEQEIATRLAEALFDGFPRASDSPKLGG